MSVIETLSEENSSCDSLKGRDREKRELKKNREKVDTKRKVELLIK